MKINFGQALVNLDGTAMKRSTILDGRLLGAIAGALGDCGFSSEVNQKISEKFKDMGIKDLTLTESVVSALMHPFEDEKNLSGSDRLKRLDMARRCNRTGMVKISDVDIKVIMPLVEKFFMGPLVSPQVECLLQGKPFLTFEEDEVDEMSAA